MTDPRGRAATLLRRATLALLALILVGAFPETASAQLGVRRWLEKLSGPGPFTTGVVYASPLCYGYKIPPPAPASSSSTLGTARASTAGKKPLVPATRPRRPPAARGGGATIAPQEPAAFYPAWECANAYSSLPNLYFYYEFSWARGAKSNLQYASVGGTTPDPSVGLQGHIVGVTFSKWAPLEIGAGFGGFRFDPDMEGHDPFWRAVIQPVRVNVRPLAFVNPEANAWHAVMVTVQSFVVLGTLEDSDFGALPGTYRESNEFITTVSVSIDFFRLFAKP